MNPATPLKYLAEVSGRVGWHGLSTDDYLTEGVHLVTGTDLQAGRVDWESCHRVSTERWAQDPRIQLAPGDVLVTKDGTIGKIALVDRFAAQATLNSGVFRIRPRHELDGRFLFRVLESRIFTDFVDLLGHGSTINHLYERDVVNLGIPLPSRAAQRVIADYLDGETARIDSLIAKKLRMIELLDERRIAAKWALLTSACQHPVRVKAVVTKVGSGSTPRGGTDVYVDEGVAFLRSQNIRDGRVRLDDVVFISESDDAAMSGTRVRAGDVLLNITGGSIGRTAVVKKANLPANVSQHVCIVRPAAGVDPTVLQAALDTDSVQQQISLLQVGGNREGLNFEQVRGLEVRVPSEGVASLAVRLKSAESAHRQALDRLALQIDLLRERRQALITAAVTGELEIPGVAA